MASQDQTTKTEPYIGYIASVILGLLVAPRIAEVVIAPLTGLLGVETAAFWLGNLSAGFFFGIAIGDPVGAVINRIAPRTAGTKFVAGLAFGILAQILILAPVAGGGMSNFIQLIMAGLYLPLVMSAQQVGDFLAQRNIHLPDMVAKFVLWFAKFPDRLLFIIFMAISFFVFWRATDSIENILIALVIMLTLLTAAVALRRDDSGAVNNAEEDFQQWLALVPEEEGPRKSLISQASEELAKIIKILIPGAVLLGGMTRLAVAIMLTITPDLPGQLSKPETMLKSYGYVAASGLGVVLFGMMAALVFCLMLLQIIARLWRWPAGKHQESCFYLLRMMRFRPLKRG